MRSTSIKYCMPICLHPLWKVEDSRWWGPKGNGRGADYQWTSDRAVGGEHADLGRRDTALKRDWGVTRENVKSVAFKKVSFPPALAMAEPIAVRRQLCYWEEGWWLTQQGAPRVTELTPRTSFSPTRVDFD